MTHSSFDKRALRRFGPPASSPPAMLWLAILLMAIIAPMGASPAFSQAKPAGAKATEQIKVRADSLTVEQAARYAEFSGNVRATQGATVIEADRVRIHYADTAAAGGGAGAGEDAIEKLVAEGNVKIQFDDKTAVTDKAVYTTSDRVLTLSGAKSTVTSGQDRISGQRIIVDRVSGRIRVEGGRNQPVEAIFHPAREGLN